ncbi:Alpha/Beta hydrolase protein [Mycena epipterygia]|nr:Alpha/Beta hydrolase protein [Mycena epipterygia]
MESASLDWSKQFFTSRGWAHIDINYGGSTGFGQAYRESLHGKWGLLDIVDAHESVMQLDALGLVDAKRAVVHGGSAGGYSVLQIATTLPDKFAAGSPHYGISDMRDLDLKLHKFERHLCDRLMGGTWDQCESVWRERSPIYHIDKIKMPLLMIHMVDEIKRARGQDDENWKVELVRFEGEGHGWRKASTIKTVLEKEMAFFNQVLRLENVAGFEK